MTLDTYRSEIRDSLIRDLLEKVRKQSYGSYLSLRLDRIRSFRGSQITFDFPVTALVGPNGGGKSTILNACACVYSAQPNAIFRKSRVGDDAMDDWQIDYDVIDRATNPKGSIRGTLAFNNNQWTISHKVSRLVKIFSVLRTVPPHENPNFTYRSKLSVHTQPKGRLDITLNDVATEKISIVKREAERILGKSLADFQCLELTFDVKRLRQGKKRKRKITVSVDGIDYHRYETTTLDEDIEYITKAYQNTITTYIGCYDNIRFSEFNFGAGEASVIRMVSYIESQPDGAACFD